jgi:hypothetical protein
MPPKDLVQQLRPELPESHDLRKIAIKDKASISRGLDLWLDDDCSCYCGNGTFLTPEALVGSHTRLSGWLAGEGGFKLGDEKSKNSSMSA